MGNLDEVDEIVSTGSYVGKGVGIKSTFVSRSTGEGFRVARGVGDGVGVGVTKGVGVGVAILAVGFGEVVNLAVGGGENLAFC